jgi:hypothetical protein
MKRYFSLALAAALGCQPALSADDEDNVADQAVPKIVLHDILTNRVCVFESKLYSPGSKVIILGVKHECVNANPMTFGSSDDKWDMKWVPVAK